MENLRTSKITGGRRRTLRSRRKYENLITRKINATGNGLLREIVMDLNSLDSIRCFFAVLFLARDQKVELAQIDDDIQVTLIDDNKKGEEDGQASK